MKYIDEYRDPAICRGLISGIRERAKAIGRGINIMEVCGSHTTAIGRFGIRGVMPKNVSLISGPGCPVCVTSIGDVDRALYLAGIEGVIFATFGDMLRVPGTRGASLQGLRANGSDIRTITSPAQCVDLARKNPDREVILMGIGFETTSPAIASFVKSLEKNNIRNACIFCVQKVIPPAIMALINDPCLNIDGFLCPGHVSTIIGAEPYGIIPEKGSAAVIAGFEPIDILQGVFMILGQILSGYPRVEIQYIRGVRPEGNKRAVSILEEFFKVSDAPWRGLGIIPESGLVLRKEYAFFDAVKRYDIPQIPSCEIEGCRCGDILRGLIAPTQCPLFRKACTPANPIGPCMVSSEGTCSAYYNYH